MTHFLQFKKLLSPGKIGQVLYLGNLTDKETYDFLRATAPDLQIVKGDFDTEAPNLALSKVVQHGGLRIGLTHGHTIIPQGDADSLLITARQMDVDVLLWGGTHKFEAYELEGKFFVNPGSASGAFSTGWWADGEEPTPSFCLMDVSIGLAIQMTWSMLMANQSRFKEMFSSSMSTNYGQTQAAPRMWQLRKSPTENPFQQPLDLPKTGESETRESLTCVSMSF